MRRAFVPILLALATACAADAPPPDAATDDVGPPDGGPPDGGAACTGARDGGPLALRDAGPPLAPPVLDCGAPEIVAGTTLRRHPYLESVTRTSARIAWTSTGGGRGVVRWATGPAGPWTEVEASAEEFPTTRTDDTEDYVAYDATITGLGENAAYCYEIVEDGVVLARRLRFDTAWSGGARPLRIVTFGDSGQLTPGQLGIRDRMLEEDFDLFVHLGDIAYGDGTFVEFEERFFGVYRDVLHRVPTFPTMGNHEYSTAMGRPYLDVYHLFENAWREAERERYYSFDYGNVHFVSLESNEAPLLPIALDRTGRMTDDQIDWLEDDLAASDADWKIAFFHHPPFTSSDREPNNLIRQLFLPVLEAGGVDLVLVGHDHHYERTAPIRELCDGSGDLEAITYVVAGGGGAGLRAIAGESWWTRAVEDEEHTYLRLTIHGCSAHGEAITADGETIDGWWLDGCD